MPGLTVVVARFSEERKLARFMIACFWMGREGARINRCQCH